MFGFLHRFNGVFAALNDRRESFRASSTEQSISKPARINFFTEIAAYFRPIGTSNFGAGVLSNIPSVRVGKFDYAYNTLIKLLTMFHSKKTIIPDHQLRYVVLGSLRPGTMLNLQYRKHHQTTTQK